MTLRASDSERPGDQGHLLIQPVAEPKPQGLKARKTSLSRGGNAQRGSRSLPLRCYFGISPGPWQVSIVHGRVATLQLDVHLSLGAVRTERQSLRLQTEGDLGGCWEDWKMGGRAPACPWRTMTQRSSQDSACVPVSGRGSVQREVLCLPQPGQGGPVWCRLQNATAQLSVVCAQMQG